MVIPRISPLLVTSLALLSATAVDWKAELTWHDQHRIEQMVLLMMVALGGMSFWRGRAVSMVLRLPSFAKFALALVFGLGLVSAVVATHPRFAMLEWATLLLLLGLALMLGEQARNSLWFDRWAMRLVLFLAVVIALKIMMGYLAALLSVGHINTVMLFEGTFSNRRFFGQVASMAVPILAYPLLKRELTRLKSGAIFGLLAIWWMLVFVSGTRGTWVALATATVVLTLFARRSCVRWLNVQLLAAMLGVGLFWLLFNALPILLGQGLSIENRFPNLATLSGRGELWRLAWSQLVAHPWLGVGPMHLAAVRNDYGAHPHNALLQLAAEWGVPAALAFVTVITWGAAALLARLRKASAHDPLLVCLTASLLASAVQSMVDGVIVIPYTQMWLVLIAGWALGAYRREGGDRMSHSRAMHSASLVLAVIAFAALLSGIYPEVFDRTEVTQAYVDSGHLVAPRYWAVGWIP